MRAVVTRVAGASVTIAGNVNGRIGRGFLVLLGFGVQHGEFGADMQVDSRNDGPVTILFDTERPL